MSKSRLMRIKLSDGLSREEKICTVAFGICMFSVIAILWATTAWEAARVISAGFLISCLIIASVVLLVCENREFRFRRKCMKIRKERTFYNYVLKGEIMEFPIEGTDLVEIRNVVAKI